MLFGSKRVLITGRYGFTGRYLADELNTKGYSVYGLGCGIYDDPQYYVADLSDCDALKDVLFRVQPDYVIHLAGLAFVQHQNIEEIYRVNLLGTRNLLKAIDSCKKTPEAILLASSANVYGNSVLERLNEDAPVAPINDYAVSKLAMEYMAKTWMNKLPITIVRPFNYTGVGQAEYFLIPKIVAHFRQKKPIIELGNINVYRDFSDVRGVVQAYRCLIERAPASQIFNVCSEKVCSLKDIIYMCESFTNHVLEIKINPDFIRPNEVKSLCGNAAKLKSFLGAWQTPTIEQTLKWMLS